MLVVFVILMMLSIVLLIVGLSEPAPSPPPKTPTTLPTEPLYSEPLCQELCSKVATGIPVMAGSAKDFQDAIDQYMQDRAYLYTRNVQDPSVIQSMYGTNINCWDVSQVSISN
mmetsp:Transcript_10110/g.18100  ORF Transcript_10110/g.18100 Transcript_10110/m.18100 type:complete len:113 (-) Transcript_10110:88-426(-)